MSELGAELAHARGGRLELQVRSLTEQLVQARAELRRAEERIAALATIDDASGALNARTFEERALVEVERSSRHRRDLALVLLEPDDLSRARQLVELARAGLRVSDLVGRADGAAIALLLPETALPGALILAERICAAAHRAGARVRAGCAGWPANGRTFAALCAAAQEALSKAAGGARSASCA